jgi:glycosyltransferase involved in cell wall biosynthesis
MELKRLSLRFVSLSTSVWGAERTLLALIGGIQRSRPGWNCELVAPAGELAETWIKLQVGPWVEMPSRLVPRGRKLVIVTRQLSLLRFLASLRRVDITHSHSQWSNLPVSALRAKTTVVLDLHDFVSTRAGRFIQGIAVRWSDMTFVASSTVQRQLTASLRDQTKVLNRPVETRKGSRLLLSEADHPKSGIRIAVVCRPDPNKDLAVVVKVILSSLNSHDELHIAGGKKSEYGLDLKDDRSQVTYHGRLSGNDLSKFWGRVDVHVLTSEREPFGRVVVEAAQHGIPSIVHEGAGAADLVRRHSFGHVISSWDRLPPLLHQLRLSNMFEIDEAGLEGFLSEFDPESIAQRYISNIEKTHFGLV